MPDQQPVTTAPDAPTQAPVTAPTAPSPPVAPAPATTAVTAQDEVKPGAYPDKWRDDFADGDETFRKQLDRVNSPVQLAKNYRAMETELGRLKNEVGKPRTLAADATPEQVAEYRKAIGVPETHDKYQYKLPEGFNFGEADKPHVDAYLKEMHSKNAPPSAVEAGLHAYAKILEQQATEYVQKDNVHRREFEDSMRQEWGNEYRANVNIVSNFINSAPKEISEMIHNGRGPDGKALLNSPNFVRWINNLAREINPALPVVPGDSGRDSLDTINDELSKLSEIRKTQGIQAWHKNQPARERERQLLSAKEKLERRKAG